VNCHKCGEEIDEFDRSYWICEKCHDQEILIGIKEKEELEPEEAVLALLRGYTLRGSKWIDGAMLVWDGEKFILHEGNGSYRIMNLPFFGLKVKSKRHPMGRLEILAWVNSPESWEWVVSRKYVGDDDWENWDLPQRFKYDGKEEYSDPCVISYRRARLLPGKYVLDESTIQGFWADDAD
jgi:hypothetical protein